jgi:hypothetical protein
MLEFLVRCVPEHVRDVVEQTVGQHHSTGNYAAPLSLTSKALHWQQQYANQPIYYYPNSGYRQTFINGYESRATSHQAFIVRRILCVAAIGGIARLVVFVGRMGMSPV